MVSTPLTFPCSPLYRGSFLRRKMKRRTRNANGGTLVTLTLWMLTLHFVLTWLTSGALLASAAESSSRGVQHFRRTPENQTATVGDRVTLACSVENKVGVLQWTMDGFGLGSERDLEGFDRYSMKTSDDEDDFSLEIYPVTLEDDAIFQCQVAPDAVADGNKELRSANATLTVVVPTSPPEIIHGDILQTTEGKEVQLECISKGGKPAAEITWIDGNNQEIRTGVNTVNEPLEDQKRFNIRSILLFRPTKDHHNKTLTCQAHNRPDELMSTQIRLEVKYAPKVTVKIQSPIREFENVRISCRAEANPPERSYRWLLNDQVLPGDHGPNLVLPNVTRKYHAAIIKCEVENAVGRSQGSETLGVIYEPLFRNRPWDIQADLGTSVTLSCDVDGNPPPIIVWTYEPTRAVVHDKANYTTTVTQNTQGKYICRAYAQGFPTISAEATIYLKKGPQSIISDRVQFGVEGDTVRLECFVESVPLPEKITWTHLDREIDSHDSDYSVLEDSLPNGKRSVLVIRSSQDKHFGPYNCTVTNSYGSHVMEIHLMKQKSGSQLVIILPCVIGGVVVIVALTIIITLLCRKKRERKQSDRSSNDSDLKVEIRTATSLSNIPEHDRNFGMRVPML